MKKRFSAKNKKIFNRFKILLWLILVLVSFTLSLYILIKTNLKSMLLKNGDIIRFGLGDVSFDLNIMNPKEILTYSLSYLLAKPKEENITDELISIDQDENDENPIIYIYNTHDTEKYDSHLLNAYNISYTVKTGSYILRDYLSDYNLTSYVENESMAAYLRNNGLIYKNSYEASKYYISKRLEEYPSIRFIIDLHRDSVNYTVTRVNIDDKNYAKMMFVVGLDYEGYEYNLHLAEKLNSMLDSRLSRGISKKTGPKVNGIYNQNLLNNAILVEVGGVDNTIDEVANSLKELARIIFECMNGE